MRWPFVFLLLSLSVLLGSCASTGYNTQKGAILGGAIGALAGQAIGRNTEGTLIGLAGGTLLGAIVGNAQDQREVQAIREELRVARQSGCVSGCEESPPGRWIEEPGRWMGRKWVPPHKVWVPVDP